jgi:hypothetical protein
LSDDQVGLVLLGSAALFSVFGVYLANKALGKAETAADAAKSVATTAITVAADTQRTLAITGAPESLALATQNAALLAVSADLNDAAGNVGSALDELKGPFAPARVLFAISFVLVLASLVSFDVIDGAVSTGGSSTTTPTTTSP